MYILNGKIYKNNEGTIAPTSQAFMFGYGVFETLKVLKGKILFMEEHLERLEKGCRTLNISLNEEKSKIVEDSYKLLKTKNIENGVLRISYSKGEDENYLVVSTRESSYKKEDYERGFNITFSKLRKNENSILTYIKSNNYIENLFAKQVANERGFDEMLFLNTEENIAEGTSSNVFWIKDNIVYTPSIECGLLAGVVRQQVLRSLEGLRVKVRIGKFTKEDIMNSDEVFLTNSVMDIMPVSKIEDKTFNIGENTLTRDIINRYKELIGEESER